MVMVKAIIFNRITDLDQSLAQAEAEASQLENLSVQNVVKFTKEIHVLHREQHVMDVTRRDILRQCAIHPGRLHSHDHPHRHNLTLYKTYKPNTRTLVKQRMLT